MKLQTTCFALIGCLCGIASAQSNVTIYGIADAGLVRETGGAAGSVSRVSSGVGSGSRLGFKGTENLGSDLSAFFQLENGYNIDTGSAGQGGLLFGRQAFVGLSSKYGAISLGRQYSPLYTTLRDVVDPFEIGLAGNVTNIIPGNTRVDNMVEYKTPRYAGFAADLAYGAGEAAGDSSKNRTLGAAVSYVNGPLNVTLTNHIKENADASDSSRYSLAVAKYKAGAFSVDYAHGVTHGLAGARSKDDVLGGTWTTGAHTVLASYIRHDDQTAANKDAHQWAVAYLYGLSKRTDLYLSYGRISNRNGAGYTVGNGTDTGTGNTGTDIGVRHRF
ncbi:porin [Rugamonas sp. A1-17]|nr:porin [Rugamonas sp. A1-17]